MRRMRTRSCNGRNFIGSSLVSNIQMRGWLRARAIGKRIECDVRGFKLSRARISTYWDRLDYVMLTSFFGEAEIPLRGNIEAPAQQIEDDDNSDSPAAIGVAQWRSRLATSLPALPGRLSTKSALQCVQTRCRLGRCRGCCGRLARRITCSTIAVGMSITGHHRLTAPVASSCIDIEAGLSKWT